MFGIWVIVQETNTCVANSYQDIYFQTMWDTKPWTTWTFYLSNYLHS